MFVSGCLSITACQRSAFLIKQPTNQDYELLVREGIAPCAESGVKISRPKFDSNSESHLPLIVFWPNSIEALCILTADPTFKLRFLLQRISRNLVIIERMNERMIRAKRNHRPSNQLSTFHYCRIRTTVLQMCLAGQKKTSK